MIKTVQFTKMQGAGNDYIYINTILYSIPDPSAASIKWSSPHTGIGSDGLVLIGKPSLTSGADFSMRIFNADGSEAMMCGNASRCIGKYLYEKGMTDKKEIRLETKSGVKVLKLHISAEDKVESVTVDMLEPKMSCSEQYNEKVGNVLKADSMSFRGTFIIDFLAIDEDLSIISQLDARQLLDQAVEHGTLRHIEGIGIEDQRVALPYHFHLRCLHDHLA